jgi:enterochelin esterase-like enzyme
MVEGVTKPRVSGHQQDVSAAFCSRFTLFCLFLGLACSSSPPSEAPANVAGKASVASGGAGASATAGATSMLSGASGAGAPSSGGNGGSAAGGSAGTTSSVAGMAGSGITCTPSADGNGTHDQPGPYGAPPEATVKPDVPVGSLTPLTPFPSTIYGHTFGYRVYVPAQYKPGQRAAFMLVEDGPTHYLGKNSEAKFFANVVMDNLIAEGTVPVTIGLFVDPCMEICEDQRVGIYDDASDKYARFVTEELLPSVIAGKYSIVQDPEAWLAVGFSAGAEQSFTVIWNRPVFHKFIGHNTSFPAAKDHGADYAVLVPQAPNKGFRVSLTSGTMDLSDARGNWLQSNTEMAKVLTDKGYPVRFMTGTGGHFPPDQSAMDFPNGLRWMWQGCKLADY